MEIKYMTEYGIKSDSSYGEMTDKIDFLVFKNITELIEYINCMCIVKQGNAFELQDTYPYMKVVYRASLFSQEWKPARSNYISQESELLYPDRIKWNSWKNYLNDVKNLPDGITVTMVKEKMTNNKFNRSSNNYRIQHMYVNYSISQHYAEKIYQTKTVFYRHENLMNRLLSLVLFSDTASEPLHGEIYICKTGMYISPWKNIHFNELNMNPLENVLQCFMCANVLLEYILEKKSNIFDFTNVKISKGDNLVFGKSEESIHISYYYKNKIVSKKFNEW